MSGPGPLAPVRVVVAAGPVRPPVSPPARVTHPLPLGLRREEDFNNYIGEESGAGGDDAAELSSTASAALARIADAIGGNIVWPFFSSASQALLGSKDWRQERAALLGLSLIASGCKKTLVPQIRNIVQVSRSAWWPVASSAVEPLPSPPCAAVDRACFPTSATPTPASGTPPPGASASS